LYKKIILLVFMTISTIFIHSGSNTSSQSYYHMKNMTIAAEVKKHVKKLLNSYLDYDFNENYNAFYSPFGVNTGLLNKILVPRIEQCIDNLEDNSYIQNSVKRKMMNKRTFNSKVIDFMNFDMNWFKRNYEYVFFVCNSTMPEPKFKINDVKVKIDEQTKFRVLVTVNINGLQFGSIAYDKILHGLYLAPKKNNDLSMNIQKFVAKISN